MFEGIDKESEEFIEDLKEAIDLNNKSTTNWYNKNKLNKILLLTVTILIIKIK